MVKEDLGFGKTEVFVVKKPGFCGKKKHEF